MDVQLRFEPANLYDTKGASDKARDEDAKVLQADPKYLEALYAAGTSRLRRRDYKGSVEFLIPAEVLAFQLESKEAHARILHYLGIVYKNMGNLDQAMSNYQESLQIRRRLDDKRGIAQSLNEIAQVHDLQGRWTKPLRRTTARSRGIVESATSAASG